MLSATAPAMRQAVIGSSRQMSSLHANKKLIAAGISRLSDEIFVEGKGSWLTNDKGEKFLDFSSGIAVTSTGHCHPHVVKAIQEQAGKLIHAQCGIMHHEPMLKLAERLAKITPPGLDCFFFPGASGAEAIENALKLARQATGRPNVIVMQGGYHGRTIATMAMTTSKHIYRSHMGPVMPGVFVAPFPFATQLGNPNMTQDQIEDFCIHQLELLLVQQTLPSETAALFIEPILGEGGFIAATPRYMQKLQAVLRKNKILLVCDEIQCGYGRTGEMFYSNTVGVQPDIMTIAKGLASGMPLSCVASRKELMDKQPVGGMGGTYAGNAVACAAALATLDVFENENLLANVKSRGQQLTTGLRSILGDKAEVRGPGLMVAVEFKNAKPGFAGLVSKGALQQKMLLLNTSAFEIIRFLPSLNVTAEEVTLALEKFDATLKKAYASL